jgi:hypothetical protein
VITRHEGSWRWLCLRRVVIKVPLAPGGAR